MEGRLKASYIESTRIQGLKQFEATRGDPNCGSSIGGKAAFAGQSRSYKKSIWPHMEIGNSCTIRDDYEQANGYANKIRKIFTHFKNTVHKAARSRPKVSNKRRLLFK
jgi:hypothetical protein